MKIVVIGGGAAGFFGAIQFAVSYPGSEITILEQGKEVLSKVRISGGGRCNVTHACFDPDTLCSFYPRGNKELRGPFHRFGPRETIAWFEAKGVKIKQESDGRMFPVSDHSATIVNCLVREAQKSGVLVRKAVKVTDLDLSKSEGKYVVKTAEQNYEADILLIATGSSTSMWQLLSAKGYHIVPPVPSLFTFNIKDKELHAMSGISVPNATVSVKGTGIATDGALLITHWGLSGPAILKASAWGARELNKLQYIFQIQVDWAIRYTDEDIRELRNIHPKKKVCTDNLSGIPLRLWEYLCNRAGIYHHINWASLTARQMNNLVQSIKFCNFDVHGKSTFKEEFVTAGGVDLKQINFRNFESKLHPGVHFAGEVLNIDALTGGFNFQAAWTGGYLAGLKSSDR